MESPDDPASSSSFAPSWGGLSLRSPWEFSSHALPRLPLVVSQFHEAAYSRRPDVLRLILSKVSSPDHLNILLNSSDPHTSNTPFLWACMTGCVETIAVVLEAGSNISCVNTEGKNGLHLAVASGMVDSVKYLLSFQSFLAHAGDCEGATPAHYASVASSAIVEAFIEAGVSFLVQDNDSDTPLHWACRESSVENVSLIYGTNQALKEVSNSEGETPFQLALLYEEKEICLIFGGKVGGEEEEVDDEAIEQTTKTYFVDVSGGVQKNNDHLNAGIHSAAGPWGVKLEARNSNLFGFGANQFASVN